MGLCGGGFKYLIMDGVMCNKGNYYLNWIEINLKITHFFVLHLPVTDRDVISELPQRSSMEALVSEDCAMLFYVACLQFL